MIATILIFLAVLSVLVIVHEFGHYAAARWAGVKVEEFGIGFPPRITYFTDKRGTKWSLNLIPLGGFVKLKGEEGGLASDDFAAQSKIKRAIILCAGVFMNVVLAAFLYGIVSMFGSPTILMNDEVPKFAHVVKEEMLILDVLATSPAGEVGIPMGSTLLAVNNVPALEDADVRAQLAELAATGQSAEFDVRIGDEEKSYTVAPAFLEEANLQGYGIIFADATHVRYPFPVSIWIGIRTAVEYMVMIVIAFAGLFWSLLSGGGVQEAVSGPVGIAKMTGQVAQLGIVALMQFAALLSVNLAVLNILPFPALDGGRLFFLGIEAIRRKPVSEAFEGRVHQLGFLFLMILVILVTYRDIARLF